MRPHIKIHIDPSGSGQRETINHPSLRAVEISENPRHIRAFLDFPFRLYRRDPWWIAPGLAETARLLTGHHPCSGFLTVSGWLICAGDRVVARGAGFLNARVTDCGAPLGTLGLFESENDPEAARLLVGTVAAWLKTHGANMLWGPMNGTLWLTHRCLARGHAGPIFYGEPYNPAYYPFLLEGSGLAPARRWVSVVSAGMDLERVERRLAPRFARARDTGYTVRSWQPQFFESELRLLYRLLSDSFSCFWAFHDIDEEIFFDLFSGLRHFYDPRLIWFLLDPAGEPVGFVVVLPDCSAAIRAMRGRNDVLARLRFLRHRRPGPVHLGFYLGVTRSAAQAYPGLGGAIGYLAAHQAREAGVPLLIGLIGDASYVRTAAFHDVSPIHEHILYKKELLP
jgi:hypothetical protein